MKSRAANSSSRSRRKPSGPIVPKIPTGKHPGGRPSEYSPQRVAPILAYLHDGNYETIAVTCADVCDWKTYVAWKERYPEFLQAIKNAEAHSEDVAVSRVRGGAPGWQGSAWYLERKHADRWSKPEQVEHTGNLSIDITWHGPANGNGKDKAA